MLLQGKVCLVTGSSRGIGAETVLVMAREGAKVTINYYGGHNDKNNARRLVEEIAGFGGKAIAVKADVRDAKAVENMVSETIKNFGEIDVLVNNAFPGFEGGEIDEVPWKVYQRQIDGILKGGYNCIRAVLPYMRRQKHGSIVNIGTASLYEGVEDKRHTPYTAAKGAMLAVTHGLANDLGKDGIRVNMVSPGICWTRRGEPQPESFSPDHQKRTPLLGRNVEAREVANVIMFYASELSAFVTGTHLPVCGGLVMCVG